MNSQEDTARRNDPQPQPVVTNLTAPTEIESSAINLYWHLRWTVPLHILLPIGLWWIMQYDGWLAAQTLIAIHVVALAFFIGTIKWWWALSGDLIGLLFINHFVTFAICLFLPW